MEVNDNEVIKYLRINKRMEIIKNTLKERKIEFYSMNMYTRTGYRDDQLATIGFKIESEVVDYASATQMAEKRLEVLRFKKHYFNHFWNELDELSKSYYRERFFSETPVVNDRLDELIYDEVSEIEEATGYRFKKKYENTQYVISPNKTNKEKMLDFTKMLELLEV